MKKVLLATTVLAMSATVAAAEVKLSGDARMGVLNSIVFGAGADKTSFTSRARVTFTLSGETDGGLAFGASFRADNAAGAAAGTAGSVFMSGAFGKISMGDVDGAANAAVGHVDGVGLTGLGDYNESTFLANGAGAKSNAGLLPGLPAGTALTADPSVLYQYTAGDVSFYASVTQPTYNFAAIGKTFDGDAYGIGAAYKMGDYKVSMGYEMLNIKETSAPMTDNSKTRHLIFGGDATFGQITLKARYGRGTTDYTLAPANNAKFTQAALSATYKMDAVSVTGFVSQKRTKVAATGVNLIRVDSYGLGGAYDLGGGASVKGGVVRVGQTVGAGVKTSDTAFDLGVAFTF